MDLSRSLLDAIESTYVAYQGLSHRLRVVGVRQDPPEPLEAQSGIITVETSHDGQVHRAQCRISLANLDDDTYVVEALAGTMHGVLSGDLKPGEIRLL